MSDVKGYNNEVNNLHLIQNIIAGKHFFFLPIIKVI